VFKAFVDWKKKRLAVLDGERVEWCADEPVRSREANGTASRNLGHFRIGAGDALFFRTDLSGDFEENDLRICEICYILKQNYF
jgi:hypothetical protein